MLTGYHTGAIIVLISTLFYIPQDRLKRILNELINRTGFSDQAVKSIFQARMEETIGLYMYYL